MKLFRLGLKDLSPQRSLCDCRETISRQSLKTARHGRLRLIRARNTKNSKLVNGER